MHAYLNSHARPVHFAGGIPGRGISVYAQARGIPTSYRNRHTTYRHRHYL